MFNEKTRNAKGLYWLTQKNRPSVIFITGTHILYKTNDR